MTGAPISSRGLQADGEGLLLRREETKAKRTDAAPLRPNRARSGFALVEPGEIGEAEWHALMAEALSPNPYYDPACVKAGARLARALKIQVVSLRDRRGTLRALMPVTMGRSLPLGQRRASAYTNPFSPLTRPFIHHAEPVAIWHGLLDGLSANALPFLRLPILPNAEPAATALFKALSERSGGLSVISERTRAGVAIDPAEEASFSLPLSTKKRKELRRLRRRLAERGDVTVTTHTGARDRVDAAAAFPELEQAGWKGRGGTAMALNADTANLFRTYVSDTAFPVEVIVHALRVDGKPIAMFITLTAGGSAFIWKTAFDENFAAFSPAGLLILDLAEDLVKRGIMLIDSCASDAVSMADIYFGDRIPFMDALVATGENTGASNALFMTSSFLKTRLKLRETAKTALKKLKDRKTWTGD